MSVIQDYFIGYRGIVKPMENKIRYFRFMNQEMTQADLAERVGVTRQTIIAIEKGVFNPSVKLALKLSQVFGVTVEEIFKLNEKD
jgi:putative transcriptional regulator